MYGVMIDLAQHEQGHQFNSGTAKREMHKRKREGRNEEGRSKEEGKKKERRRKEEGSLLQDRVATGPYYLSQNLKVGLSERRKTQYLFPEYSNVSLQPTLNS